MSADLIIMWGGAFLVGLSLAFIAYVWMTFNQEMTEAAEMAGPSASVRTLESNSIFIRLFGPLIILMSGVFASIPYRRAALEKKLAQAGNPGGLNADEFQSTRIIATLGLTFAGLFLDSELMTTPIITLCFIGLGLFYPDLWLNGLLERRRRRIFRDLPDMLDTLRLAVDAGLDFGSAMAVVVEKGRRGPLLEELEKVERDMSLGMTRADSFRKFAERLAMPEINAFVLALIQADQLGASIGPVLKTQSDMARTKRWQIAEILVNKMPMKMLGPLVVFIFPASFIILFTPLLIQFMQSPG